MAARLPQRAAPGAQHGELGGPAHGDHPGRDGDDAAPVTIRLTNSSSRIVSIAAWVARKPASWA